MSAPTFSDATLTRESQRFVAPPLPLPLLLVLLPLHKSGPNSYLAYPGLRTDHVEQHQF